MRSRALRRRTQRIGVSLFILGLSAGACTTQEAVPPGSRPPLDASTSTIVSESTLTTGLIPDVSSDTLITNQPVADTRVAGTQPPVSAVDPTPPVTSPTGVPTSTITEFFVGGDADGWLLLGRWNGGAWEQFASDVGDVSTIGSGATLGVHELGVAPIDAITGPSAASCSDGRTGPSISPNAGAPQDPGFGFRAIAFTADWSPVIRSSATVNRSVDEYVEAGRAAFSATVVDTVDGAINQIVVSDLDGDGDSESLVAFGGAGYSVLLVIDANSGTSQMVARSISRATPPAGGPPVDYDTYRILAVVDLNGDGVMEFVTHSWRGDPATSTATAYAYDGTAAAAVLSTSC
jgi:hypothetical protein